MRDYLREIGKLVGQILVDALNLLGRLFELVLYLAVPFLLLFGWIVFGLPELLWGRLMRGIRAMGWDSKPVEAGATSAAMWIWVGGMATFLIGFTVILWAGVVYTAYVVVMWLWRLLL